MIHFVYAGSPQNNLSYAPYTITQNLYKFLASKDQVKYYDWCESNYHQVGPNDIIIGHPNYGHNTIIQRMFRECSCKAKCLIHPLHHGLPEHNLPFDNLAKQANAIFSIMGEYWYDTLEQSPFAHWKPKITRVDMAIDISRFQHFKKSFNPPGQRNLLYIGRESPEKGTHILYEIVRRLPNLQFWWFGAMQAESPFKTLPNAHILGWADFTPQFMTDLSKKTDFFLNTSISDANPTTLLEAAAWGFPTFCTPQSGYYGDIEHDNLFVGLKIDDIDYNLEVLNRYQYAPESDLIMRSNESRAVVARKYTWNNFCNTIWNRLEQIR